MPEARVTGLRRAPPERFQVFVSYTTRDEEVALIKPYGDRFLNNVLRPAIEQRLGDPPFFYDNYALYRERKIWMPDELIQRILEFAIEDSEILLAFVSPRYVQSRWCQLECKTMRGKPARPWFDICREPPIGDLADKRIGRARPTWWDCLRARWYRRRARARAFNVRCPGGTIIPILWKGDAALLEDPLVSSTRAFDWRPCIAAAEATERVGSHLIRHRSVSPTWEDEATSLTFECTTVMQEAAEAIVHILEQRRIAYREAV